MVNALKKYESTGSMVTDAPPQPWKRPTDLARSI